METAKAEVARLKNWTWATDGVNFNGDGTMPFRQFTAEELGQWLYATDRANSVFDVLMNARARFETGMVDYAGACGRLHRLLDECDKAGAALMAVSREIVRFFPDSVHQTIAALAAPELHVFIQEAIPLLQAQVAKKEPDAK